MKIRLLLFIVSIVVSLHFLTPQPALGNDVERVFLPIITTSTPVLYIEPCPLVDVGGVVIHVCDGG